MEIWKKYSGKSGENQGVFLLDFCSHPVIALSATAENTFVLMGINQWRFSTWVTVGVLREKKAWFIENAARVYKSIIC